MLYRSTRIVHGTAVRRRKVDLKKTLFILPNLITVSSIFCGFYSIVLSGRAESDDDFYRASLMLVFAIIFDMLDGRVARMTKTQSAFGLQIDSLADVVSFGAAPAQLVYKWTLYRAGTAGLVISFLFLACGAIRLARFNVLAMGENGKPSKPSKYIVGLPIPGAAGVLISLVIANHAVSGTLGSPAFVGLMIALTLFLSFLMVSTVRFRSFKDLKPNKRTFALVSFALLSSIAISIQTKPAFVLVWLLSFYVAIGVIETTVRLILRKPAEPKEPPVAVEGSGTLPPV